MDYKTEQTALDAKEVSHVECLECAALGACAESFRMGNRQQAGV